MKQHALAAALSAALSIGFAGAALANGPDENRFYVVFKPSAEISIAADRVEQSILNAGGTVHYRFDKLGARVMTIPPSMYMKLKGHPDVLRIERDHPRYPMAQTTPYGVTRVQAPDAVDVGADGAGVKVCIIDSGINAAHEDFAGVTLTGQAGQEWNNDGCGHGTHVAGTIAAADNDVGVIGVTPGTAALHIVKVFGTTGSTSCGWSYSSDLVDAAQECANSGAKIISMSLGGGGSDSVEEAAFQNLFDNGVLSIAAAGNDGNSTMSYPASYDAVMSVAATDSNNAVASFSQYNEQVEIAAPGVGVLSTYPGTASVAETLVAVDGDDYSANPIEGTIQGSATGNLVNGGLCDSVGAWTDQVVLCQRGSISFLEKVQNAQSGGADAVILYNNVSGNLNATLGEGNSSTVPAVSLSMEDGQALVANKLGASASVSHSVLESMEGYDYLDGTSMATPHVSGVAALVWSAKPDATAQEVRDALTSSAMDLGDEGRDYYFGCGLAQAFEAVDVLLNGGGTPCGAPEPPPPPPTTVLENGVAVPGVGGATGAQLFYSIEVPAGATNLSFNMSGGTGDADLYVKFGSAPSNSSFDCRSWQWGNNEACSFATPQTGTYYVLVDAYSAFSGATLVANFTAPLPPALPTLAITNVDVQEGNDGTSNATMTVTLSEPSETDVFFTYSTADGTATAGSDYVARENVRRKIPAGSTVNKFGITINGDLDIEADESFTVNLTNAAGADFASDSASVTILNDDILLPTLSIADVEVQEGDDGTSNAVLTVVLSEASDTDVFFTYSTADGSAAAGSDYVARDNVRRRIPAGSTVNKFGIAINGDTDEEADETFTVNLGGANGANLADGNATVTILNDDIVLPILTISDVELMEGNDGTSSAVVTVTLSEPSATDVFFTYSTVDGTATAGSDYVGRENVRRRIPAGSTVSRFGITVNGDVDVEADETFTVSLSKPVGVDFLGASSTDDATVIIRNDD